MTRDDGDLHAIFHAAAPPVRPVDVDALFAAAGAGPGRPRHPDPPGNGAYPCRCASPRES